MKTFKIGKFDSFKTYQWKEGIELTIPDDMNPEEYLKNLSEKNLDEYEKLKEQMYDMDVNKEKFSDEVSQFWYKEINDELGLNEKNIIEEYFEEPY